MKQKLTIMLFALVLSATAVAQETMIVRLAEIEVYPEHLQEYLKYANEVDRLSVATSRPTISRRTSRAPCTW